MTDTIREDIKRIKEQISYNNVYVVRRYGVVDALDNTKFNMLRQGSNGFRFLLQDHVLVPLIFFVRVSGLDCMLNPLVKGFFALPEGTHSIEKSFFFASYPVTRHGNQSQARP